MPSISRSNRSSRTQKLSAAGLSVAGAAALVVAVAPGASASDASTAQTAGTKAAAAHSAQAPVAKTQSLSKTGSSLASNAAKNDSDAENTSVAHALSADKAVNGTLAAKTQAESRAKSQVEKEAAAKQAADDRGDDDESSRAGKRESYPNNLDGWIREARSIMADKGIPGSYEGIKRNIIRESGGDPNAQNDWDVNAQNGVPSKGLLQVIQPTFDAYHVDGTSDDSTDPVANIVAACNYAADRYGSMDNVDSAY